MTVDEIMGELKGIGLDVRPHQIQNALASRPDGDIPAAVGQVKGWVENGENRSNQAGTLLLAALRSQARTQPKKEPKTDWGPLEAEAKRLLPGEPEPFVIGAIMVIRSSGGPVTAAAVRARLKVQGRTKAQLRAAA